MEKANLPTGKAHEPNEEARQPLETMSKRSRGITFDVDPDAMESQSSSKNYKDVLSQPAPGLTHHQKLLWLQQRRTAGLWVQCDDCNRWRYLSDVLDSYDLPKNWYCRMNPDTANAVCSAPEAPLNVRVEEDLIHSEYSVGSVVWARMAGWPWWPAMVDDCPDTEQFYWLDGFSDIPTHYNVVFFDSTDVTRGWITPENLKPFTANKKAFMPFLKDKKYKTRLRAAVTQADKAANMPLQEKLEKCSFIARYKGNFNSPKKVSKKEIKKHMNILKRKFNIEFAEEAESDEEVLKPRTAVKHKKNVIVLGSPKGAKKRASRTVQSKDVTESVPVIENSLDNDRTKESMENEAMEHIKTGPVELILESKSMEPNVETEQTTEVSNIDVLKRPNSLAVQIGSNNDLAMIEEPFDDDTSKTYEPSKESQESTELTQLNTVSEITEFRVTIDSPKSDDFDF